MKNYAKCKLHFRLQVAHIVLWENMIAKHGGEEGKMELLELDNRISNWNWVYCFEEGCFDFQISHTQHLQKDIKDFFSANLQYQEK